MSQRALAVRTESDKETKPALVANKGGKGHDAVAALPAKEVCKRHLEGKCKYGDKCLYAHTGSEKSKGKGKDKDKKKGEDKKKPEGKGKAAETPAPKDKAKHLDENGKPRVCKYFQKGKCSKGDSCLYAHIAVSTAVLLSSLVPEASGAFIAAAACMYMSASINATVSLPHVEVPSIAALANVVCSDGSILDSGSGCHLRSTRTVDPADVFKDQAVILETALGPTKNASSTMLAADDVLPQRTARVLDASPAVTSLGLLCMQAGFSFFCLNNHCPVLVNSDGNCYQVPLSHFVPILQRVSTLPQDQALSMLQQFASQVSCSRGALIA